MWRSSIGKLKKKKSVISGTAGCKAWSLPSALPLAIEGSSAFSQSNYFSFTPPDRSYKLHQIASPFLILFLKKHQILPFPP